MIKGICHYHPDNTISTFCIFCSNKLIDPTFDWENDDDPNIGDPVWVTFHCEDCHCDITTLESSGELLSYIMYYEQYKLHFDIPSNKFKITQLFSRKSIIELSSLPNIHPNNLQEKIKTLLTFS